MLLCVYLLASVHLPDHTHTQTCVLRAEDQSLL